MKQLQILTFIFIFFALTAISQNSSYTGEINLGKSTIKYQIDLNKTEINPIVLFSSADLNAFEIPCQQIVFKNDSLSFSVFSDYFIYQYHFLKNGSNFSGSLNVYANESEELLNTFSTNLIPIKAAEIDKTERVDITFTSNELELFGTLWKPKKSNQIGLLFVTSSQGNDKSGTNAEANYFANLGYTVFNYDKRGTGNSQGDWKTATIEELCLDDINALQLFSKVAGLQISEIGIKGSSQGGIKIPYILTKVPDLKFGISISCPSGTLLESDLNSWRNSVINKIGTNDINLATSVQKSAYDYIAGNISYPKLNELEEKYKSYDWFKYIWIPEVTVQKDPKLNFSGLLYFEKITQPILVIQGLSDVVIPSDSYKVIERAIKKSSSKNYEILTLKNTSHSMSYIENEFPYFQILTPQYLQEITYWLQNL